MPNGSFEAAYRKSLHRFYTPEGKLRAGEAEPATKKDLKELFDEYLYVPKDPEKALEYYKDKRRRILTSQRYSQKEAEELMNYYNDRALDILVENPKLKENWRTEKEGRLGEALKESFKKGLLKTCSGLHYGVRPGWKVMTHQKNPFLGLNFEMEVQACESNILEKKEKYSLAVTDQNDPETQYLAKILFDLKKGEIKVATTIGINKNNIKQALHKLIPKQKIEIEALVGLLHLMRIPEYENKVYQENRAETKWQQKIGPHELRKKEKSTLNYKRRSILSPEMVRNIKPIIDGLISSLTDDERKIIEKEAGSLNLLVYAVDKKKNRSKGMIGSYLPHQLGRLQAILNKVISSNERAIITIDGLYRPRWLDQYPPGTPKRPHVRRLREHITLILGGKIPSDERKRILKLWNKRKKGLLLPSEQEELGSFFDRYGISRDLDIKTRIVNGIYYKDGRFVPGEIHRGGSRQREYIIKD